MKQTKITIEEWNETSRCVCYSLECNGRGLVATPIGERIEAEVQDISYYLEDLGLDAPPGISIWEGNYIPRLSRGYECDDEDLDPIGEFRRPTPEELECIVAGVPPWIVNEGE